VQSRPMAGPLRCGGGSASTYFAWTYDATLDPPRHLNHLFFAGEAIIREVLLGISQLLTVEEQLDLFRSLARLYGYRE
jgi:hypothetical protein